MRALLGALAVGVLLAASAASAASAESTRTLRTYYCQGSNTTLRIIFDASDNTADVNRIRQPTIRLRRAQGEGENFRYVRPGRNTHELTGNMQQVRWRVGNAVWDCSAGG
jgi:hypothetical protein